MTGSRTIEDVKAAHEELYNRVLADHRALLKNETELNSFISNADRLLEDIRTLSAQVVSLNDYMWLSDAAVRWQTVFSSLLNMPKEVKISPPLRPLEAAQPARLLPEDDIDHWITERAKYLSKVRKATPLLREADNIQRIPSSPDEMEGDWRNANIDFCAAVLEGRISFCRQVGSRSYYRLERQWLQDVLELNAYHIWESKGGVSGPDTGTEDYDEACEQVRQMLVNRSIKAAKSDFEEPMAYIETHFLTDGAIDRHDERVRRLIASKASRVSGHKTDLDLAPNLAVAEMYVKTFYENIIPAVLRDDPERVLMVLKAFQYGNGILINCFEVALAIYFLDPDMIEDLWRGAQGKRFPASWSVSAVAVESWPKAYVVPAQCEGFRFDEWSGHIVFEGVMTEAQKTALIARLREDAHVLAVNDLFERSRLLPREVTFARQETRADFEPPEPDEMVGGGLF